MSSYSAAFADLTPSQTLVIPDTVEEFLEFVKKHYALVHPPLTEQEPFSCVICANEEKTQPDCSIARKCASSAYPCDGECCQCKYQSICFECLVSNLFTSTSSVLKSQKRFRAKCPFCKASYCHLDLVYYATIKPKQQTKSAGKRGGRRRRGAASPGT